MLKEKIKLTVSMTVSRSKISQILNETIEKGSFSLPHVIFDLPLSAARLGVITALFKVQDESLRKSKEYGGWFFATDRVLARLTHRHPKTVKRSIQWLKHIGVIDYRRGSGGTRRATEYRILIDPFYLADRMNLRGTKKTYTRTKTSNYYKTN